MTAEISYESWFHTAFINSVFIMIDDVISSLFLLLLY